MNKIGFALEGEMGRMPPEFGRQYRADAGRRERTDETAWRPGEARMGQAAGEEVRPLTRESAMEWTGRMENADGSTGPPLAHREDGGGPDPERDFLRAAGILGGHEHDVFGLCQGGGEGQLQQHGFLCVHGQGLSGGPGRPAGEAG